MSSNNNKVNYKSGKIMLFSTVLSFILIVLDQITKYLACTVLKESGPVALLPGVFEFRYLENQGAAFGMLENMQWIFILFALVISGAAIWLYLRLPAEHRLLPLRILCITLTAGALGNMIDRICHHFVIDFLYFSAINFPIFNVADIYVCVSTAVFLLLILFYYKEEDLDRIMGRKSRQEFVSDIVEKIKESKKE